jgi:hypothetical protein
MAQIHWPEHGSNPLTRTWLKPTDQNMAQTHW